MSRCCFHKISSKMLALCLSFLFLRTENAKVPDTIFYWDTEPFIFFNEEKQWLDGVLPSAYMKLGKLCSPSSEKLENFTLIKGNFSEDNFYKMIEDTSFSSNLQNGDNRIWFPLFINPNEKKLEARNLKSDIFIYSPYVGVIVNKYKITVLNKFFEAIKLSYPIGTIAGGLILLFSTLLWLAECVTNKDFSKCFINGFGSSLWLSIVTLTTVGYGDIVPKSLIGRFISILWMVIGVLFISGLTGMFSSIITTNSFLSIQNNQVAGLNNSIDFQIARKNYNSSLKAYSSYYDVLHAVENRQVDYGVINIDVLLNMKFKEFYPNVVLVQIINAVTPAFIVYGKNTSLMVSSSKDNFAICRQQNFKDIVKNAQNIYEKIPIIDIESPQNLYECLKTSNLLIPGIVTLSVLFAISMKDVVQFVYKKRCSKDVSLSVILNGNKDEEKKSTDNFFEELSRIEEQIIKLKSMYKKN
ncbi:uncharacterized protein LOC100197767 isoform X2 [Hydra vulgaris]|uniref:Uncharacterized protein LOC100197767 isoform X2 n=1 Tax=Hydra vulgaris TaxID=6087 RepID=A0ABM4B8J5_HYDVU